MQELFVIPEDLPAHIEFSLRKMRPQVMVLPEKQVLELAENLAGQNIIRGRAFETISTTDRELRLSLDDDDKLAIRMLRLEIEDAETILKARLILWKLVIDYHLLEKEFSERYRSTFE